MAEQLLFPLMPSGSPLGFVQCCAGVRTYVRVYLHVHVGGCLIEASAGDSSGLILVFHLLTHVEQMLG